MKLRTETRVGTLTITDGPVVQWFCSMDADLEAQDEWVRDVTGRASATVHGYTVSTDPLELEIEYQYVETELAGY